MQKTFEQQHLNSAGSYLPHGTLDERTISGVFATAHSDHTVYQ